jgi:hypothetical protein
MTKFKFKIWINQSVTPRYRWVTLAADGSTPVPTATTPVQAAPIGPGGWYRSRPRDVAPLSA